MEENENIYITTERREPVGKDLSAWLHIGAHERVCVHARPGGQGESLVLPSWGHARLGMFSMPLILKSISPMHTLMIPFRLRISIYI